MANKKILYLGADHNGFKAKEYFKKYLLKKGFKVLDMGNKSYQKLDDYPTFAQAVARKVGADKDARGLLFCGSGQGMAMAANRYKKVRAALGCSTATAKKSRLDNDSNMLCLSSWEQNISQMKKIIDLWLSTKFSGLIRHARRIKKIDA